VRSAGLFAQARQYPLVGTFVVAVGVALTVLAVAISHGAAMVANGPIDGLSRNVVVVEGVAPSSSGVEAGLPTSSLTSDDVSALGNSTYVPGGLSIAPTAGIYTQVHAVSRTTSTDVIGSTGSYADVLGDSVAQGRFLDQADVQASSPVAVLGQTVAESLFSGSDPIGQQVTVAGHSFQVVGTLRAQSDASDQNNLVVLPITTEWQELLLALNSPINQILIRTANPNEAASVAREVTTTLLRQHNIANPAQADFTVLQQSQLVTTEIEAGLAVQRLLEVAAVVLLVAGSLVLAGTDLVKTARKQATRLAPDSLDAVVTVTVIGLIGAVIGVAIGVIGAPFVHDLSGVEPAARVSLNSLLIGAGFGVAAAAVSVPLGGLLDRIRR
jgi:putative ABC transport system permease protein